MNVTRFPNQCNASADQYSGPQSKAIAESIKNLVSLLPARDQHVLLDELIRAIRLIPASRSGEVLGAIARFLPERKNWTAEEIKKELAVIGVEASSRETLNAITYLVRKGQVQRVGHGKYLVEGMAVHTSDNLGGEPWAED